MLHQKYTFFCMKVDKTQGSPGGIRNIEIRVVQIWYRFVPTFFSHKLKVMAPKIYFGTGHEDIGQKL